MAVSINTKSLSRNEAQEWIADRGIERLPASGEQLEYVPAGRYDQFNLVREGSAFALTSNVLA